MNTKRLALTAVILLMATSAFSQKLIQTERYAKSNAELKAEGSYGRPVLRGDSITDGWPGQRPAFFKDNALVGRGISGEETSQMLLRFRRDVLDVAAGTVVIFGGINDIAENLGGPYSEDKTFDNLVSMAELARAHNIRVILCALLPSTHFGWNPAITDVRTKVASLNARLKAYAKANGILFADYYTPLAGPDGISIRKELSPDSVHPNADGYAIMEKVLLELL